MEFNFKSDMEINKVNVQSKLNTFKEYWTPKIVGELNNQFVKIAKFKGEFVMHKHEQEDELFYVINGKLFIELADKNFRTEYRRICHYSKRSRT
jgi:mannose-6-phosphate isomerase-like protein (cupin superfamily)